MLESILLGSDECESLLRAGVAGRVAVSTPDGPRIVPLNYSVVDNALIFPTSPDTVLGRFGRNALLAFEVDQLGYADQHGWSVVASGRGQTVEDQQLIEHILAVWPPQPWADGERTMLLRLEWTELTGRRLGRHWDIVDELPVRRFVPGY